MHSLFRLLAPVRVAPRSASVQRDSIGFVLDDGRRIDVLRVRDPRARRIKLSVDERGARLSLPLRASLVAGERFLHEHLDWLARQLATSSPPPTRVNKVARSSGSCQNPCQWPLRMATKYSAKLQLATSMKTMQMASSKGD